MIDLKQNPDHLHAIASNVRLTDQNDLAHDLDNAAHDLKNLRDYSEQLERSVNSLSAEIASIRDQRETAAKALLAIFRPELEDMIDQAVRDSRAVFELISQVEYLETEHSDLVDRLDALEADDLDDTKTRDAVKDMIRDGDIVVTIDHI